MELTLEDFVPYDVSSLWRIPDGYYATRGRAAWTEGEVPFEPTSNYAMARQQARLLIELVRELGEPAAGPLHVLEVGSGVGRFAANFLLALEIGTGVAGRDLARRVRYVLSDFSRKNLEDAVADDRMRALVDAGRVVPALLDARKPGAPVDLEGRPIADRFTLVIANYVCCVLPPRILRTSGGELFERRARLFERVPDGAAPVPDRLATLLADPTRPGLLDTVQVAFDWHPVRVETALEDPHHRAIVTSILGERSGSTVVYPAIFLDFVLALESRVVPSGMVLVTDYGDAVAVESSAKPERRSQHYGNTISHPVSFATLDAFCRHHRLGLARTTDRLASVHTAAIQFGPPSPRVRARLERRRGRLDPGQGLLDLRHAARLLARSGDRVEAARFHRICHELDPGNVGILFELGVACFEAARSSLALRYLRRGRRLDGARRFDFDFQLGRVHAAKGALDPARRAFLRSLAREENPSTHANLGVVLDALGDRKAALASYRRSLELGPPPEIASVVTARLAAENAGS